MPKSEKMTAAKLQLIEEEKKKLQVQQKALDPNAQMTLSEIKALQKENNKRIIDRVLFVLGLIMATLLMAILVWPTFSTSMNFFNFKKPQAAYDQGTITATPIIRWKDGYEPGFVTYYIDPDCPDAKVSGCSCQARETIKNEETGEETTIIHEHIHLKKVGNVQIQILKHQQEIVVQAGSILTGEDSQNSDYKAIDGKSVFVSIGTDDKSLTFTEMIIGKGCALSFEIGAVSTSDATCKPKDGANAWGVSYDNITQLNERVAKYSELHDYTIETYEFKAARGVFFAGFNPGDAMLCTLYCICGILFFIILIGMIVGYVVLMSYGIRYFVGLIKSVTMGAKVLITETGRNVAGAVLEETADQTLDSVAKEQARKRKAAAEKRKATLAKKKEAQDMFASTEDTPVEPVTVDVTVEEEVKTDASESVKDEAQNLDDLTEEQLNAMLSGNAPRDSLFSDEQN